MTIHIPHYNIFGRDRSLRIAITIACQCAFVLFGYDQGVFSGIVGNQDFLDQFGHPSPSLEGIIVSIYNLGAFSGCILTFAACDRTGRRMAMWIAMLFIIVGAILQASAFTVPHLMIARYITGIGTGRSLLQLILLCTITDFSQVSRLPQFQCISQSYAKQRDEADSYRQNLCSWGWASKLPIGSTMACHLSQAQ